MRSRGRSCPLQHQAKLTSPRPQSLAACQQTLAGASMAHARPHRKRVKDRRARLVPDAQYQREVDDTAHRRRIVFVVVACLHLGACRHSDKGYSHKCRSPNDLAHFHFLSSCCFNALCVHGPPPPQAVAASRSVKFTGSCLYARTDRPQKITFAEMRASGVRGLLIYCSDYKCSHSIAISGDRWPDDVRLSDIERRFTCQACGQPGRRCAGRPRLPDG
jgi:hypothetical protein